MQFFPARRARPAFTLVELLVVIAIVAVLIGLLVPAVQQVRASAQRTECVNNLKQIGLACHNFHAVNGHFPPGYVSTQPYADGATDTAPGWGWPTLLLPYLEQGAVYDTLDLTRPVQHPSNAAVQTVVKAFLCPSDSLEREPFQLTDVTFAPVCLAGPSSYAATCGPDASDVADPTGLGVFYRNSATRATDITDGTSCTVLIGDRSWALTAGAWAGAPAGAVTRAGRLNPWPAATYVAPTLVLAHNHFVNVRTDSDGGLDDFSSLHAGGVNLLFADGSVRFVRNITDPGPLERDFQALGTCQGGEVISTLEF
jgi:prepilin-type N-terminal cleavage/methylation domain-containing protein/prepilin-type processing-associated H-X9-DG protein